MNIQINLTSEDLKSNIILQAVQEMLQANTTISIVDSIKENKAISAPNFEFEDITPPQQQNSLKSNENTQKSKGKTKEERLTELKNYANSIYKDLSDAKKKSLKSFVAFYEKKIKEQDFNINYEKQFNQWWNNDKNNR